MGQYSSRLNVTTFEKSSDSSRCRRINSRYTPIGVEPVGSPSTVGTPAELFSRIKPSTTRATCLSTSAALCSINVGIFVFRRNCDEPEAFRRGGVRTVVIEREAFV